MRAQQAQGSEGRTGLVIDGEWLMQGMKQGEAEAFSSSVRPKDLERGKPRVIRTAAGSIIVAAHELESAAMQGSVYQVGIYPMDPLLAAIGRMRRAVFWCGAAGTLVVAMAAWGMARRFSRPITDLVAGTERVRRGDFKTPVAVRSRDELGKLAHAFNGMTRDLELKDRYHEMLGQVSDPAVAKQLLDGGLQLGGEVREVAVLFCDIRGFTALTENMEPQEVIEMLNHHMTSLTKIIHAHGGVVDKFVGDLVMALFGVPVSYGDDSRQAVRCALAMMAERAHLNRTSTPSFEMGIGLASGPVVAGCMGSDTRLNYTVLGERVNLASRLCSAAAAGEILIDETLALAATGEWTIEAREPAKLKGFSAPVPVFAVTG
jgi:class 3 adenylate cyclase